MKREEGKKKQSLFEKSKLDLGEVIKKGTLIRLRYKIRLRDLKSAYEVTWEFRFQILELQNLVIFFSRFSTFLNFSGSTKNENFALLNQFFTNEGRPISPNTVFTDTVELSAGTALILTPEYLKSSIELLILVLSFF